MKKKTVIICIIVAVAVFASSLTVALLIFNKNRDSEYSLSTDNTPDGKAVKSELNGCKTAEDYYNLARRYVDEHKIFYANEIIKTGYQKTKAKSLDIAVITGKPTVESAIISHLRYGISESIQYYLGRDTVISRPCFTGLNPHDQACIYTFDPETHRIDSVEIGSRLSYGKTDKDLQNIVMVGNMLCAKRESNAEFSYKFDGSIEQAMKFAEHHAAAPLYLSYQMSYDENGKLEKMICGDTTVNVNATDAGFEVGTKTYSHPSSYPNGADDRRFSIDMQGDNILRVADDEIKLTETFNYADDGSYTLTLPINERSAKLTYDANNLITSISDESGEAKFEYNSRQLLSRIDMPSTTDSGMKRVGQPNEMTMAYQNDHPVKTFGPADPDVRLTGNSSVFLPSSDSSISYIDDLYITNYFDTFYFSYDSDNRIVKMADNSGNSVGLVYNDKHQLSSYQSDSQAYTFQYDSNHRMKSFEYGESEDDRTTYDVIYNDNGSVYGLSQQGAEIWTLEGNKLYTAIGNLDESKVCITRSDESELFFSVCDATKEDFESCVQSYKDAGYTNETLDRSNSSDTNSDTPTLCWFSKQDDSSYKFVRICWDPKTALYTVKIYNGKDSSDAFYKYQQDKYINGFYG